MFAFVHQPDGFVPVDHIELLVLRRFERIRSKVEESESEAVATAGWESEDFVAGSQQDINSHFLLRLASVVALPIHAPALRRTFLTGESLLFRDRVSKATPAMLRTLHAKLHHDVKEEAERISVDLASLAKNIEKIRELRDRYLCFLKDFAQLLEATESWYSDHLIQFDSDAECSSQHIVKVPWRLVQQLIAKKNVSVSNGFVDLPCHLLLTAIHKAMEENLRLAMETLMRCEIKPEHHNPRLVCLANQMAAFCITNLNVSTHLLASEVRQESVFFPPCMKQPIDEILANHNCHHNTRFHVTVFLKSIGMEMDEQIKFWKTEYSKPAPSLGNKPKWNERRHGYSIRHIYGLEGKRVPQEPWDCSHIQAQPPQGPGPICLFLLPASELVGQLPVQLIDRPDDIASIVESAGAVSPGITCATCLRCAKQTITATTHIASPAEYYLRFKNLLDW